MKTPCFNSKRGSTSQSPLFMVVAVLGCVAVPLPQSALAATADIIWKSNAHPSTVSCVTFSPDSSLLASGSFSGPAKLWQAGNGAIIRQFAVGQSEVQCVAFSPDATRIAGSREDHDSWVWDIATGARIWGSSVFGGGAVAYRPDATLVAFADRSEVNLRNAADGFPAGGLFGHVGSITSLDFSPEGTRLASGSRDRTAKVWNVADRVLLTDLVGHAYDVLAVRFSSEGRMIASGSLDGTTRLWNVTNGLTLRTIQSGSTAALDFSPVMAGSCSPHPRAA